MGSATSPTASAAGRQDITERMGKKCQKRSSPPAPLLNGSTITADSESVSGRQGNLWVSKIALLRKVGAQTVASVFKAIRSFVPLLSAQECANYFRHAGYASVCLSCAPETAYGDGLSR
jgi:hypothetical protein